MSKKTCAKKNDPIATPITTTTSQGADYVFATYGPPSKKIKKSLSTENFFEGHFHYRSHATWRSEVKAPIYSRRTSQQFIDARNILCLLPAFRDEIIEIRTQLSLQSVNIGQIAAQICSTWKVPNGEQWIAWLIKHWDPTTTMYPPHFATIPLDSFPPWTVELNYLRGTKTGEELCRSAIITLNAGVSERQAIQIAKLALKKLDDSNKMKGRPGTNDLEREVLRSEFVKLGIPKKGKRASMIRKVQKACTQSGKGRFSGTFIGNELRRWLREQKQPVRRYMTEPSS